VSTQLYINDSITTAERFTGVVGEKKSKILELSIDGISISGNEGSYYCAHNDDRDIPKVLLPHIKEISFRDSFRTGAPREVGIYKYGSATAEVNFTTETRGTNLVYTVSINGKTLGDIRTLFSLIKTGAIPASESFERKQQGKTRAELEAELSQAKLSLDDVTRTLKHINEIADSLQQDLQRVAKQSNDYFNAYCHEHERVMSVYNFLADELLPHAWRWCSRRKCAKRIFDILKGSPASKIKFDLKEKPSEK
jgi:hypothetical protein